MSEYKQDNSEKHQTTQSGKKTKVPLSENYSIFAFLTPLSPRSRSFILKFIVLKHRRSVHELRHVYSDIEYTHTSHTRGHFSEFPYKTVGYNTAHLCFRSRST